MRSECWLPPFCPTENKAKSSHLMSWTSSLCDWRTKQRTLEWEPGEVQRCAQVAAETIMGRCTEVPRTLFLAGEQQGPSQEQRRHQPAASAFTAAVAVPHDGFGDGPVVASPFAVQSPPSTSTSGPLSLALAMMAAKVARSSCDGGRHALRPIRCPRANLADVGTRYLACAG